MRSCKSCNVGWSDDEAHFKSVLLLAGEPNAVVHELWNTSMRRVLQEVDGSRRALDLVAQMRPVTVEGQRRHMIYPGQDGRVVRVLGKIVRGLCHHHGIGTAISEERVWADVIKYQVPPGLLESLPLHHVEPDIFEYWYEHNTSDPEIESVWFLRFFERRMFIATVRPHDGPRR